MIEQKPRKKLDLPQAIIVAVVLGSVILAAGLVLTWGPSDSRALVAEGIAGLVGMLGVLFTALRSKGLLHESEPHE